ncbi:MAG: thioredoxin-disulfide reductase [Cellulosilyticaceae bacterium]
MNREQKDIVIVGAGPAGLSAGVYAGRARLDAVILEKGFEGGQMLTTEEVDNYLGVLEITGPQLSMNMYEHAKKFGVKPRLEEVIELRLESEIKEIITQNTIYEAKTVILAMGATPKKLGADNEENYRGRGVSYCAICDGGFFIGKTVVVVGGGDKAVEDALYLERMAQKVYLVHRKGELRASKVLQEQLFKSPVEILWNKEILSIQGEQVVTEVILRDTINGKNEILEVDGIFVAVGSKPTTDMVKGILPMDGGGYIVAGEDCVTTIPGVFVAGDLRVKPLRQILTAVADGAVCIYEAEKYLLEQ